MYLLVKQLLGKTMKNTIKLLVLPLLLCLVSVGTAWAKPGSIVGSWKTIDDETNQAKSVVQIYKRGGKYLAASLSCIARKEKIQTHAAKNVRTVMRARAKS